MDRCDTLYYRYEYYLGDFEYSLDIANAGFKLSGRITTPQYYCYMCVHKIKENSIPPKYPSEFKINDNLTSKITTKRIKTW